MDTHRRLWVIFENYIRKRVYEDTLPSSHRLFKFALILGVFLLLLLSPAHSVYILLIIYMYS